MDEEQVVRYDCTRVSENGTEVVVDRSSHQLLDSVRARCQTGVTWRLAYVNVTSEDQRCSVASRDVH